MANRHNDPFDDYDDEDDGYLTFDAREEDDGGGNRTWLILAGAVLLVLVIGIVGYNLFMGGNRAGDDAPVVAAADGEFKQVPDASAPVVADDADKGVLDPAAAGAPPLSVEPLSGAEDPLLDPAATGVPGAAAPVPPPAAPVSRPASPPPPVKAAQAPPPRPASPPPPPPPPVRKAEAAAPVAPSAATRPSPPPPAPGPVQQAQASPPPPAAAPATTPATAQAATAGAGRLAAQLGSFQTRSAADAALARYRADGLGGTVSVVAADLGEKGTWYRIRAVGFESRAEVDAFCSAARARGVNCIPASR